MGCSAKYPSGRQEEQEEECDTSSDWPVCQVPCLPQQHWDLWEVVSTVRMLLLLL